MKEYNLDSEIPCEMYYDSSPNEPQMFCLEKYSPIHDTLGIKTFSDFFTISKEDIITVGFEYYSSQNGCRKIDYNILSNLEKYFDKEFPKVSLDYPHQYLREIKCIPEISDFDVSPRLYSRMRESSVSLDLLSILKMIKRYGGLEKFRTRNYGLKTKNELSNFLEYKLGVDSFCEPKIKRVAEYLKRLEEISLENEQSEKVKPVSVKESVVGKDAENWLLQSIFEKRGIDIFKKFLREQQYEVTMLIDSDW